VQPLLGYVVYLCSCCAVGAYVPTCGGDFFVNTNVTNKYDPCVNPKLYFPREHKARHRTGCPGTLQKSAAASSKLRL